MTTTPTTSGTTTPSSTPPFIRYESKEPPGVVVVLNPNTPDARVQYDFFPFPKGNVPGVRGELAMIHAEALFLLFREWYNASELADPGPGHDPGATGDVPAG